MAPPTFAGLTGRKLGLTVSTIATMGFLLFGYDREFSLFLLRGVLLLVYRLCTAGMRLVCAYYAGWLSSSVCLYGRNQTTAV